MSLPLFRTEHLPGVGAPVVLDGQEGRHAGSALRLSSGERFLLGDGRGTVCECEVTSAVPGRIDGTVLVSRAIPRPDTTVTVVQALPKSERSELAVELATEAGVDAIVPWQSERCVSRWTGPKIAKGQAKWTNAVRAAAKQSRRAWEPEVSDLVSGAQLEALISSEVANGALAVVLHEQGAAPFATVISQAEAAGGKPLGKILLIIGPEGGISEGELARLVKAGAQPALLGPEVLRTSTAAAVALGALGVLTTRWAKLVGTTTTLD